MKRGGRKGATAPQITPLGPGMRRAAARRAVRFERERRLQRLLYLGAGILLALVVVLPVAAYWRTVVGRAGEPVAVVAGKTMSLEDYAKLLSFEQYVLQLRHIVARQQNVRSMANLREQVQADPEMAQSSQFSPENLRRIEQQIEGSLLQEQSELGQKVLTKLARNELLRREADVRGFSLTPEDLVEARLRIFGGQEEPAADKAPDPAATPTASPTPEPTPTPPQGERLQRAQSEERALLAGLKTMSPEDFERLVVIPAAYQLKLDRMLRDGVPAIADQVHARHILVNGEEEAGKVRERLLAGEDFATVAKEVSKDTSSAEKGGDLNWQPQGAFVKEFEQAVFALPANELSEPVKTSFGYHIVQVLGREVRPVSDETRKGLQDRALDRLLTELSSPESGLVSYSLDIDQQLWARSYLARRQSTGLLSFLRG